MSLPTPRVALLAARSWVEIVAKRYHGKEHLISLDTAQNSPDRPSFFGGLCSSHARIIREEELAIEIRNSGAMNTEVRTDAKLSARTEGNYPPIPVA